MKLLSFHKLSPHRNSPRLWFEGQRLDSLGFPKGTNLKITPHSTNRIRIEPTKTGSSNQISSRRAAGGIRPILDINSQRHLNPLDGFEEFKISASYKKLIVSPSIRAFHIAKSKAAKPPYRVFEAFCGGGTLSQAFHGLDQFKIVTGLELVPEFADAWEKDHPEATLIQSDLRLVSPLEIPPFDILVMGIPCTDHSNMGRAKKKLAAKSESGKAGSLFVETLRVALHHLPLAILIENVPNFGNSLAGLTIKTTLEEAGYHLHEQILEPHKEWGEISNRKRWVCTACLTHPLLIEAPGNPSNQKAGEFLDPENDILDQQDALRIENTIRGLRAHNARHKALGHGFELTTINRESTLIPTIPASYHKINTGPFVETKFGLRMLRLHEVEAIMGAKANTPHYATGIRILGQGVLTKTFHHIAKQMAESLQNPREIQVESPTSNQEPQLTLF